MQESMIWSKSCSMYFKIQCRRWCGFSGILNHGLTIEALKQETWTEEE